MFAQPSSLGNWWTYFGNKKINNRWNWHHEIQYRNYNFIGDLEQLLIRSGIGYNLSENNNNLLLGYGFIKSTPYIIGTDIKKAVYEHRIFQQFITRQSFSRFFIQHRYRMEERFIEKDFKMRFRYFLSLNMPISKKTLAPHTIYLSAYNEIFINNQQVIFDRNRIYGAAGYILNKHFKVEVGCMRQLQNTNSRNQLQFVLSGNY